MAILDYTERLPNTPKWRKFTYLLKDKAPIPALAYAAFYAAAAGISKSFNDIAVKTSFNLLVETISHAGRGTAFPKHLTGSKREDVDSLPRLANNLTKRLEQQSGSERPETDAARMARLAASEALIAIASYNYPDPFENTSEQINSTLLSFYKQRGVLGIAKEYISRYSIRYIHYFINRELPYHIGGDRLLSGIEAYEKFLISFNAHYIESAIVIEKSDKQLQDYYSLFTLPDDGRYMYTDLLLKHALKIYGSELRIKGTNNAH